MPPKNAKKSAHRLFVLDHEPMPGPSGEPVVRSSIEASSESEALGLFRWMVRDVRVLSVRPAEVIPRAASEPPASGDLVPPGVSTAILAAELGTSATPPAADYASCDPRVSDPGYIPPPMKRPRWSDIDPAEVNRRRLLDPRGPHKLRHRDGCWWMQSKGGGGGPSDAPAPFTPVKAVYIGQSRSGQRVQIELVDAIGQPTGQFTWVRADRIFPR